MGADERGPTGDAFAANVRLAPERRRGGGAQMTCLAGVSEAAFARGGGGRCRGVGSGFGRDRLRLWCERAPGRG